MDDFINQLEERLKKPLPGQEAQFKMAHLARRSAIATPETARQAGVLALFYPKNGEWHLVFIERDSSNPNDRHSGQISFPGGKYEEGDGVLVNTALREAQEEVGINPNKVKILGALTELYIPISNFLVNPFVGFTNEMPNFVAQVSEVHSILEVPLSLLQQREIVQTIDLQLTQHITLREVPHFNLFGKVVWGATAMMLSELLETIPR